MKKVFHIFTQDLKSIIKNPAAIFIFLGLCFLPSLYAWINIKACWDPYANTGNLPVAVVSQDEGTTFNGKNINVGNEIVAELKKNKAIHWVFTDNWQGNYGMNEGKYYAMIEIPSGFSKDLVTLASATPKKPNIIYHVSEKENAIANKITNVAVDQLAGKVKSNFISVVNRQILSTLNLNENNLKKNKNNLLQLRDTIQNAYNDVSEVKGYIDKSNEGMKDLQNYLKNLQNKLPLITEQISNLQKVAQASCNLTEATRDSVNNAGRAMNSDVMQIQTINRQMQTLLSQLDSLSQTADSSRQISDVLNEMIPACENMKNILHTNSESLQELNKKISSKYLSDAVKYAQAAEKQADNLENSLKSMQKYVSGNKTQKEISARLSQVSAGCNSLSNSVTSFSNSFYNGGMKSFNQLASVQTTSLNNLNTLLDLSRSVVPQLKILAGYGISSSKLSVKETSEMKEKLSALQETLESLKLKTRDLTQDNIDSLIHLMGLDSKQVSEFLASPIDVKQEDIFNVGTFGEGLTPFYTVLAIWVGALLACALLTVEVNNVEHGEKLNLVQKHFGKMLLFLLITTIQSTIIITGDIHLLGIKPADVALCYQLAILCSVTFTVIIFTLVSLFGNVGKAIAVVMMVFQIAGAGGIYPIQTNPAIFGTLEPLWPFTYAIDGFREAIAGPVWNNVTYNVRALLFFLLAFLCMVVLKKPFHYLNSKLEKEYKKAGL